LESIVVDVLAELRTFELLAGKPIPVIAAGGVYSGGDIARMLDIGASAVQMGTRFVATVECDAPEEYKRAYLDASADDVVVVQSPLGVPARILLSSFVERTRGTRGMRVPCKHACLRSCDAVETGYCIANAMVAAANGDFENGFAMCGQNVYRVDKIVLVDELMATLVGEATCARDGFEYRRQRTPDEPRERILVVGT
jgi:NAD(P)H-dependent flavin oxidoreductase YrpB (nitropropane dioxygenase family)